MIIHLGPRSPVDSCNLPGGSNGQSFHPRGDIASLFGLAPGGVCRAGPVTRTAVSSYLAFSPLPEGRAVGGRPPVGVRPACRRSGGMFSVALSLGSPPLGVTQHPALWSSDFPPPGFNPRRRSPCLLRSYCQSTASTVTTVLRQATGLSKQIYRVYVRSVRSTRCETRNTNSEALRAEQIWPHGHVSVRRRKAAPITDRSSYTLTIARIVSV